jgi:hypothetical protein
MQGIESSLETRINKGFSKFILKKYRHKYRQDTVAVKPSFLVWYLFFTPGDNLCQHQQRVFLFSAERTHHVT